MTIVKIRQLDNLESVSMPYYATKQSAGLDLSAAIANDIIIESGEVKIIPTGIAIELPEFHEAQIRPRSGLAAKHGVTVLNSPGTIDADYRGEIKVILINHGKDSFIVTRGMRIAQMVIAKYEHVLLDYVESFEEATVRGDKGFGSTGI
jgi:dUTP pyrophosphatase